MLTLLLFVAALPTAIVQPSQPINAAIGDASWIVRHGTPPPPSAGEIERIRVHLAFVASRLEHADVDHLSPTQQRNRIRALSELRRYTARGVFPRRASHDGFGERRPRFIDDRGVHCAVGELIRTSGHPSLARAIDQRASYAYVPEIDSPPLDAWAIENGFTAAELAMIQPQYGRPLNPENLESELALFKNRAILACDYEAVPKSLTLRVRLSSNTRREIEVVGKSTRFSECFLENLENMGEHPYQGAHTGAPYAVTRTLRVDLGSTREAVERIIQGVDLSAQSSPCWQGGQVPTRKVRLRVRSPAKGPRLDVEATTTPSVPGIESCFVDQFHRATRALRWTPKGIDETLEFTEATFLTEDALTRFGRYQCSILTTCLRKTPADAQTWAEYKKRHGSRWRYTVNVHVAPEPDPIQVTFLKGRGSAAFRQCAERGVTDLLKRQLKVPESGAPSPFIDNAATTVLQFDC